MRELTSTMMGLAFLFFFFFFCFFFASLTPLRLLPREARLLSVARDHEESREIDDA